MTSEIVFSPLSISTPLPCQAECLWWGGLEISTDDNEMRMSDIPLAGTCTDCRESPVLASKSSFQGQISLLFHHRSPRSIPAKKNPGKRKEPITDARYWDLTATDGHVGRASQHCHVAGSWKLHSPGGALSIAVISAARHFLFDLFAGLRFHGLRRSCDR